MEEQMIQSVQASEVETLEDRLRRGIELLFDMERRGEYSGEYDQYLHLWFDLLNRYEELHDAEPIVDGLVPSDIDMKGLTTTAA
jgi:hypothetical protein